MDELLSARLRLRPPLEDDVDFLVRLMNSDRYLEHVGDRGVRTVGDASAYLRSAPIYRVDQGRGFNVIEWLATGQPVGICGLVKYDPYETPEIGYALLPEFSGQGIALEAAQRVVAHAFNDLGLPELFAITSEANVASRKLLEKLGMVLQSINSDGFVYRLSRSTAGAPGCF